MDLSAIIIVIAICVTIFKVTDNLHEPSMAWIKLKDQTCTVYEEKEYCRLNND